MNFNGVRSSSHSWIIRRSIHVISWAIEYDLMNVWLNSILFTILNKFLNWSLDYVSLSSLLLMNWWILIWSHWLVTLIQKFFRFLVSAFQNRKDTCRVGSFCGLERYAWLDYQRYVLWLLSTHWWLIKWNGISMMMLCLQ